MFSTEQIQILIGPTDGLFSRCVRELNRCQYGSCNCYGRIYSFFEGCAAENRSKTVSRSFRKYPRMYLSPSQTRSDFTPKAFNISPSFFSVSPLPPAQSDHGMLLSSLRCSSNTAVRKNFFSGGSFRALKS